MGAKKGPAVNERMAVCGTYVKKKRALVMETPATRVCDKRFVRGLLVVSGTVPVMVKGGGDIGMEEGTRYSEGVEVCARKDDILGGCAQVRGFGAEGFFCAVGHLAKVVLVIACNCGDNNE